MSLGRRTFLRHTALGAAGVAAAVAKLEAAPALPAFDDRDPETFWRAVRDQFR